MSSTQVYPVTPYKADGGFEPPGVLALLTALAVVGALLGMVASYISQWFYLIVLFPAAIGMGLGLMGAWICRTFKMRNPWIGAMAGFLGGVFAMGAMHYAGYYQMQVSLENISPEMKSFLELPQEEQDTAMAQFSEDVEDGINMLRDRMGVKDFVSYMDEQAKEGVTLKKAGSSGHGIELGYTGSLVYWGLEALIVAGIALMMLRQTAGAPFCRACSSWKTDTPVGFLMTDRESALSAVKGGKMSDFERCKPSLEAPAEHIALTISSCPGCKSVSPIELLLVHQIVQKKNQAKQKTLAHVTYPGAALAPITVLFSASKTAAAQSVSS